MMTSEDKVIKRGVSLYREDWEYLDEEARRYGTSASAVIRRLIRDDREYREAKKVEPVGEGVRGK